MKRHLIYILSIVLSFSLVLTLPYSSLSERNEAETKIEDVFEVCKLEEETQIPESTSESIIKNNTGVYFHDNTLATLSKPFVRSAFHRLNELNEIWVI